MRYLLVFVRNMMCKWSLICHCLVQVVYLEVCATFPSSCSWMSLEGPEWVAARCIGSIIAIEFVTSKMESFKVRHRKVFATKSNPSIRNSQTRFKKKTITLSSRGDGARLVRQNLIELLPQQAGCGWCEFQECSKSGSKLLLPIAIISLGALVCFLKRNVQGLWELCCCAEVLELETATNASSHL